MRHSLIKMKLSVYKHYTLKKWSTCVFKIMKIKTHMCHREGKYLNINAIYLLTESVLKTKYDIYK